MSLRIRVQVVGGEAKSINALVLVRGWNGVCVCAGASESENHLCNVNLSYIYKEGYVYMRMCVLFTDISTFAFVCVWANWLRKMFSRQAAA